MSTKEEIEVDLLEAKDNLEKAKEALAKLGSDTSSLAYHVAEAKVNMLKVEVSLLKTGLVLAEAEAVLSQNDTPETREKVSDAKAKVTMLESRYDIFAKAFAAALLKASTAAAPISDEVQRKRAPESEAGELSTGGKRAREADFRSVEGLREFLGNPPPNAEAYRLVGTSDLKYWDMLDRQEVAYFVCDLWGERAALSIPPPKSDQRAIVADDDRHSMPHNKAINTNQTLGVTGHDANSQVERRTLNKVESPFVSISGGPGSGKSRFLDSLANWELRGKLLDDYQAQIAKEYGGTLPHQYAARIKVMRDAVGVAVTFNQTMSSTRRFSDDPVWELAARILWSHFSDRDDWDGFLETPPSGITLVMALKRVIEDAKDKHVIICIDELLLGCEINSKLDTQMFTDLMNNIGAALEYFPTINIVVSTVGFKNILDVGKWSRRHVQQFKLSPLSDDAVATLCKDLFKVEAYRQVLEDAYGYPRLVKIAHGIISFVDGIPASDKSQSALHRLIAKSHPLAALSVEDDYLFIALRAALLGRYVSVAEDEQVDEAVKRGFVIKAIGKNGMQLRYLPVMPPLVIICLRLKIYPTDKVSPMVLHLLFLCDTFLSYDRSTELKFNPKAFENQISILFQIRCALLPSSVDGKDVKAGSKSKTTFEELLTPGSKSPLPIVWGTLAKEVVEVPVFLQRKTFEDSTSARFELDSITPEDVCVAERENFEGIDLLIQAPMVNKDRINLVVGIQVKYGKVDANSLDVNTLADAIINTSTHKALEIPIDEGRFLFVAAVYKNVVRASNDSVALTRAINERNLSPNHSRRALKIAENVIILDREVLRELFTPSLSNRLHLK